MGRNDMGHDGMIMGYSELSKVTIYSKWGYQNFYRGYNIRHPRMQGDDPWFEAMTETYPLSVENYGEFFQQKV